MKTDRGILVLDCGATNVKACLVGVSGTIISSCSLANHTRHDPGYPGGLIWDIGEIMDKLADCSRNVCEDAKGVEIIGVTATSFGVDGAAVRKDGTLCYPVISWQCRRTEDIEKNMDRYFDRDWLYETTGLQSYHFNTIHKLVWLYENRPDVLKDMDYYILMPSLILYHLSGVFITDVTMAGTTMLSDLRKRAFRDDLLSPFGLSTSIFPSVSEPGKIIGSVTRQAAEKMGLKAGTSVLASGHDTQFAILASGAVANQPVLSSGTWEILMLRAKTEALKLPPRNSGVTIELDAVPGLVNPGIQWVASGILEWIGRLLYSESSASDALHGIMIHEAGSIDAGSQGVRMIPELFAGGFSGKPGGITGFSNETTRAHFYRAALEALSYYLAFGLDKLQQVGNYTASDLICVGGGSKNPLWNQIRADVLGIPVKAFDMKESTALGAALLAMTGLDIYKTVEEAFHAAQVRYQVFEPGENSTRYREFYKQYVENVFTHK